MVEINRDRKKKEGKNVRNMRERKIGRKTDRKVDRNFTGRKKKARQKRKKQKKQGRGNRRTRNKEYGKKGMYSIAKPNQAVPIILIIVCVMYIHPP